MVVAHLFTNDEKMSARKLAGVLLGFAGVTVMIGPALLGSLGNNLLAQLACVTAALCYAFAGSGRAASADGPFAHVGYDRTADRRRTGHVAGGLAGRPALARRTAVTEGHRRNRALAVVCSAFAYVLYFRLIDRAGATNALLVTLLVPPVAIFLGSLVLHEVIEPRDLPAWRSSPSAWLRSTDACSGCFDGPSFGKQRSGFRPVQSRSPT